MKLVQVTWLDAVGGDGWVNIKDLEKEVAITHTSVGFVVADTPEHFTLSMSYDKNKTNMGAWMLIPKKYILKVKKITVK